MAKLATKAASRAYAAQDSHSANRNDQSEIIKTGLQLAWIIRSLTVVMIRREGVACGMCDSCLLRLKGFAEAGARDPLSYATGDE